MGMSGVVPGSIGMPGMAGTMFPTPTAVPQSAPIPSKPKLSARDNKMLELAFKNVSQTTKKLAKYNFVGEEGTQFVAMENFLRSGQPPTGGDIAGVESLNCLLMESGTGEKRWPTTMLFAAGCILRHILLFPGGRRYYVSGNGSYVLEIYLQTLLEVAAAQDQKLCSMMNISAMLNLFTDHDTLKGSPLLPALAEVGQSGASAAAVEVRRASMNLLYSLTLVLPTNAEDDTVVSTLCCVLDRVHTETDSRAVEVGIEAAVRLLAGVAELRELGQTLGYA